MLLAQLCTGGEVNALIPALAKKLETAGSPIIVVDQATGWEWQAGADTVDGCHPNERGEEKMATRWYDALTTVLPKPAAAAKTRGKKK